EVEINDARDAPIFKQRVIAKQIRMHRSARQIGKAMLRLERELLLEQRALLPIQKGLELGHSDAPPLRPARICQISRIRAPGEMQAREQRAELAAFGFAGLLERMAGQARYQGGGLAVQLLQIVVR